MSFQGTKNLEITKPRYLHTWKRFKFNTLIMFSNCNSLSGKIPKTSYVQTSNFIEKWEVRKKFDSQLVIFIFSKAGVAETAAAERKRRCESSEKEERQEMFLGRLTS